MTANLSLAKGLNVFVGGAKRRVAAARHAHRGQMTSYRHAEPGLGLWLLVDMCLFGPIQAFNPGR